MMKKILLALLLVAFAGPAFAADKESAYDRVMAKQSIRCGYAVRAPLFMKDPNTGEFSGMFYEYTENIAAAMGLKVEWAEEVGWGDIIEALRSGRIDAFCAGMWPVSKRVVHMDFIMPIAYEPLHLYVRADDTRFDGKVGALNAPEYSFISIEGSTPDAITLRDFPKAQSVTLPQLTATTDVLMSLVTKKADATLVDIATATEFEANNKGSIKRLTSDRPLRAFGVSIGVAGDEYRLKRMFDLATDEFLQTGFMDEILAKYAKHKGSFLRVAQTYERVR